MKVSFLGTSHAAQHLSAAAAAKGFDLVPPADSPLIFVSEDTPTDADGRRDLDAIRQLVDHARRHLDHATVVLTSAVPPGFTRSLGLPIWHQSETLRIKDAEYRALHPEMLIVGGPSRSTDISGAYWEYLLAWDCPLLKMLYEEAELCKIAINTFIASQVDTTNRLCSALCKVENDLLIAGGEPLAWNEIVRALNLDKRIGTHAYLTPGRWQDSPHLLRDARTLAEVEAR